MPDETVSFSGIVRLPLSSLRTRLLLLVAVAYVPATAVTLWAVRRDRAEAEDAVRARLTSLLAAASEENDAVIRSGRRIVGTWSQVPDVATGSSAACEAALQRLMRFAPSAVSPTRVSAQGYVDCGGVNRTAMGRYLGDNPIFQKVIAGDSTVLGAYLPANSQRQALVPVNVPLRDREGQPNGILSVGMELPWLRRLATTANLPQGTVVAIADSTGRVITRVPASNAVGTVVPHVAQTMKADIAAGLGDAFVQLRRTADGQQRLVAYQRLASTEGSYVQLAVGVLADEAFAATNRRARIQLAVLIGTGVLALLLAWIGADLFVLRDVGVILGATRRLGTGDLAARTGLADRGGELGQLAEAFDAMASQLERRQERMRHAERMESLGRLAGGVAHDFNNLLTAIVGSADLALEELPEGHPARTDLLAIKSSASRSSSLTRQLLDFSRRAPLLTEPQPLDRLVQEAAALLVRVVPANVVVDVRTASTRLARVDAGRIEQALINLAVNARDAMPNGGTIVIALDDFDVAAGEQGDALPPAGRWIRLRVSDTGVGMPPEVVRRVFEPFFTTKAPGEGTGLGLAMVYGTVQHHGGHVHVESVLGLGTTVSVYFPESGAATHLRNTPQATPVPDRLRPERVRVLVAEDQPEVRTLMERVLGRAGYEVITARDGLEAVQLAESIDYAIDVLVTDYDMPGLRGDQAAQRLREHVPELPVVLTSGYTRQGWPDDLLDTPHVVVLEKPFSADALIRAVESARANGTSA